MADEPGWSRNEIRVYDELVRLVWPMLGHANKAQDRSCAFDHDTMFSKMGVSKAERDQLVAAMNATFGTAVVLNNPKRLRDISLAVVAALGAREA